MLSENLTWIPPWKSAEHLSEKLVAELLLELSSEHELTNCSFKALARRDDSDEVLFKCERDGNMHYAVVHLTWSGITEANKQFPFYYIFEDLNNFVK